MRFDYKKNIMHLSTITDFKIKKKEKIKVHLTSKTLFKFENNKRFLKIKHR